MHGVRRGRGESAARHTETGLPAPRDGHTLVATISLAGTQDEALKHTKELDADVHRAARGSGVQALLTGSAPFYKEFTDTTVQDLGRAEKIAFPVSLLILLFAFGSL